MVVSNRKKGAKKPLKKPLKKAAKKAAKKRKRRAGVTGRAEFTPKQLSFVKHLLADGDENATKAVIAAGYSKKGASSKGAQLLANVKVLGLISQTRAARNKRLEIKGDEVIHQAKNLAFSNVLDYYQFDSSGPHLDLSGMTRDQAAAIESIKVRRHYDEAADTCGFVEEVQIKFAAKMPALKLLANQAGVGTDKFDVALRGDVIYQVVTGFEGGAPGSRLGEKR